MSKVARVIEEWELDGVGDQLEAFWVGTGDERRSLRSLADWFNRRLLAAAHERVGESAGEDELRRTYELLTDDDVSSGARTEAETRLEQRGIDVAALRDDFVSHQSIYTYLTEYRGVSRPSEETSDADQIEKTGDAIRRLVSRTKAVVRSNLETLHNTDRITIGSFTVFVDVQVFCQDCETQYSVEDLLSNRGCACSETD
jgi:hypothetical protein